METKALCFVFVLLILVTLPSESEASINGWRKRKAIPKPKGVGEGLFQKKRNFWDKKNEWNKEEVSDFAQSESKTPDV